MAEYIDGEYIADLPKAESLSDDDLLIVENSEATMQATFAQIKGDIGSIKNIIPYYGVAGSPDFYPSHDGSTASVLGSGALGSMILGDSGTWQTEIPEMAEYDYLWMSLYIEYSDGTTKWLDPIRLTDEIEKEDIKALIAEVAAIQSEIAKYSQKIQDNADLISEIGSSVEKSETAISDLEERLTTAESGIEETASAVSSLTERVNDAESGISDNAKSISDLTSRIDATDSNVSQNASAISTLETRMADAESGIGTNKSSISSLQTRVGNTESDISDIKDDIKSINSNIEDIKNDIESLMERIGETDISDMGDGTITGAIDSVRYAHVAPDEEGDN